MTSGIYNQAKYDMMVKAISFTADTIKVALMNNSHSFDATNSTWADVSANEITGTGYTTGGNTLTGKTVTKASTTYFDATDVEFQRNNITAYHAVIYDTSNSNHLICSIDLGGARTVAFGTFTIQWSNGGIVAIQ